MPFIRFGSGACSDLQVVMYTPDLSAPLPGKPRERRWTLWLIRPNGSTSHPHLVRVSFTLAPGVRLKPVRNDRSFFLQHAESPGRPGDKLLASLATHPTAQFSDPGARIEIYIREGEAGGAALRFNEGTIDGSPGVFGRPFGDRATEETTDTWFLLDTAAADPTRGDGSLQVWGPPCKDPGASPRSG